MIHSLSLTNFYESFYIIALRYMSCKYFLHNNRWKTKVFYRVWQPFATRQRVSHALRASIPKTAFTPCRQARKWRLAYAPVSGFQSPRQPFAMEAHALRAGIPKADLGTCLWEGKGAWHTLRASNSIKQKSLL
jgi:hypothetical protein